MERACLIDEVMTEAKRGQSERKFAFVLKHENGPKAAESSAALRSLPSGSPVLEFRTVKRRQEGTLKFVDIGGETVVVQLDKDRKIFRSTCVRAVIQPNEEGGDSTEQSPRNRELTKEENRENGEVIKVEETGSRTFKAIEVNKDGHVESKKRKREGSRFVKSRSDEIERLIRNGMFRVEIKNEVQERTRIFETRWVHEIQEANSEVRYKSRLVAQNYGYDDAATIARKATTVRWFSHWPRQ